MARSAASAARLSAVAAAKRVHRGLDLEARVKEGGGQVDVFEVIAELDISLIFKPLDSALGLCLPKPLRGIMITTRRGLHIQRFTAAHELAHVILDHEGSIDQEILERDPSPLGSMRDLKEVQADIFAAEFLLPRWLYFHHATNQGWGTGHLKNPEVVYQLSLRMGASYEATCWGLSNHSILSSADVEILRNAKLARLKTDIGRKHRPVDSWADVWKLTTNDQGCSLSGNPDDLVRIDLEEHVQGGFEWNVSSLQDAGYEILDDQSHFVEEPMYYGASSVRSLVTRPPKTGVAKVKLKEIKPWLENSEERANFEVFLDFHGKEDGGLSRAFRRRLGQRI